MLKLNNSNIDELETYRVMDMIDGSTSQELVYSQTTIRTLRNMYTIIRMTPAYEKDTYLISGTFLNVQ